MIVTRRRRKRKNWGWPLAIGLLLVAVVAAIAWPPSRQRMAAAFDASANHRAVTQRDRAIADLRAQIAMQQKELAQAGDATNTSDATAVDAPSAPPSLAPPTPAPSPGDLTIGATPDMRRTAQMWAAMDPDEAAKIVLRMRPEYAARIFALMPADAAGQILDALPAPYGARVTQEQPQLRP